MATTSLTETLTTIRNQGSLPQQLSLQDTQAALQVHSEYGQHFNQFLSIFAPQHIEEYTREPQRCFFGKAPTLAAISAAYGKGSATAILVAYFTNLSEFAGARHLSIGQLDELSALIASEYYYLRITEIMLFIRRFKTGRYGRFYGNVDPLVITEAMRSFIEERREEYVNREKQMAQQKRNEDAKGAVSYAEYERLNWLALYGDEEAQELLDYAPH